MSRITRGHKLQLKSPIKLAIGETLKYRFYLILSLLLAILAGCTAVYFKGEQRFTFQGKMFYSPSRVTEPYYFAPSLDELQPVIVQSKFIQRLHERFGIKDDMSHFARQLRFQVNGLSSLEVRYTHRDPKKAERVVQGSMEQFIQDSTQFRLTSLGSDFKDFESDIERSEEQLASAYHDLTEKLRSLGIQDIESLNVQINRLGEALPTHYSNLESAQIRRDVAKAQIVSLLNLEAGQNADVEKVGAKKNSLPQQDESVFQDQIVVKQKDVERSQLLLQRDLISQADFEKVKRELEVMQQLRSPIQALDEDPEKARPRTDDRTETVALLQGSLLAAEQYIEQKTTAIENDQKELDQLKKFQLSVSDCVSNAESIAERLNRLQETKEELHRSLQSIQSEFRVTQDSMSSLEGVKNNHVPWFAAGFIGMLSALTLPLFAAKLIQAYKEAPRSSSVFGLPVLAFMPSARSYKNEPEIAREKMKRAAVRVAHEHERSDGVISIAGGDAGSDHTALVDELARHYRRNGVEVTVVKAADLLPSSPSKVVDSVAVSPDEVVSNAKQGRGLALIESPLLRDIPIGEAAASSADSVVLVASRNVAQSPQMQRRLKELSELGINVIGAVLDQ